MLHTIEISKSHYELFSQRLNNHIPDLNSLDNFRNECTNLYIINLCRKFFNNAIENVDVLLNNPNIGIAALDVPESNKFDSATNAILGAAIVLGVFNSIAKSEIDILNKTPFTLHTSSHSSGKLLDNTEYTPDTKLGFHNDGVVSTGNLGIPNHIVVYNMYISYRKPGNFRWIPTCLWEEANHYGKLAENNNMKVKIKLTPYYHQNIHGDLIITELDSLELPISTIIHGQRRFFINGKLRDDNSLDTIEFVRKLLVSLENNPFQICIEQKERRAFFLKNTVGFHARDIFQEPIDGVDLTRVFLRSVDVNAELYPSSKIEPER